MLQTSLRDHAWTTASLSSLFLFLACSTLFGQELTPPKADHHAHLFSPAAGQILRRGVSANAKEQDSKITQGPIIKTASDLIAVLDEGGIKYATALSGAYLFGLPEQDHTPTDGDEYVSVQNENDWLLQQVKPYAGRLIGFCSENPLRDYAVKEIKRCASISLRGLKLQFATSNVDLQNPDHIEKLKAVFSAANAVGLPILVHLPNCRQTFGVTSARNFIEQV